jgi:hypothetical protein
MCETGYARSRQPSSTKEGFFMSHAPANHPHDAPRVDFRLTYHRTITTITPLTDACREWLEANVEIEPWQRFGPSIALEPRYVEQLALAMIEEGFLIEDDDPAEEC